MKAKLLFISFGIVTILLSAFFITFSCSEDLTTAGTAGTAANCAANSTTINTPEELQAIKDTLGGNFCLNQDIDLASITDFEPIGTSTTPFTGTLDGNSKKITNLTINRPGENTIGLFGETSTSATIKDLSMENISVVGGNSLGILVGINRGTITNITIIGTSFTQGRYYLGGLVGENIGATITNATSNANITGIGADTTGSVGGLVGYNHSSSTIIDSSSSGTVNVGALDKVGGLVGDNNNSNITNSHTTGNVTGNSSVGGLIGENSSGSSITNSYATGTITANETYAGGLIAYSYTNTTITNSYATGNITAPNYTSMGGLVGALNNSQDQSTPSTITNSYATGNLSGKGYLGGLLGEHHYSTIENSYAIGSVTSTSSYAGGLAGISGAGNSIRNCYATGAVSGEINGGLIASSNQDLILENNYFDTATTGVSIGIPNDSSNPEVVGITTGDIISGGSEPFGAAGWNFTTIWSAEGNNVWPRLRP